MRQPAVSRNLAKLRRCNYSMVDYLKTNRRSGPPRKLIGSEDVQAKLLSEDCLKRWAHLSIRKRCVKIKSVYDVDVPW